MTACGEILPARPRVTQKHALVKKLEELGIGRPSTYAPTISTIVKRNYVEKREKDGVKRETALLTLGKKRQHRERNTAGEYRCGKEQTVSYRSGPCGNRFPETIFYASVMDFQLHRQDRRGV
jgi:hypothetical protein